MTRTLSFSTPVWADGVLNKAAGAINKIKVPDAVKNKIDSFKASRSEKNDRALVEKNMKRRKELALQYEQNNVPAGDEYYKLLYDSMIAELDQFCGAHKLDRELERMNYPWLRSLKDKAYPNSCAEAKSADYLKKAFGAVVAAAMLLFLSGMASGTFQFGRDVFFG